MSKSEADMLIPHLKHKGIIGIDVLKIVITSNYIPVEIEDNLENNTKVNIIISKIKDSKIIGKVI